MEFTLKSKVDDLDELKKKWGTMQKVLSSKSRMSRVVSDIIFDFSVKPPFFVDSQI